MYRFNQTKRFVLISTDEVIAKAAIDQSTDVRLIENCIEVAEERFIVPALGDDFYESFISKKNIIVTNANQAELLAKVNDALVAEGKAAITADDLKPGSIINAIELVEDPNLVALWNRFLWRICAEAVDMMTTVPSWLRHTAQGQQHNNPNVIGGNGQNSASGSRRDVEFKMDKMIQDRINPLIERMHKWICDRSDVYPDYEVPCGCEEDGVSDQFKGGWIMGVYDDDEEDTSYKQQSKPVTATTQLNRLQFIIEPGQTVYPVAGQPDENEVRDILIGAKLDSFSIEGIELFIGENPGEMKGLNSVTGQIEWNEAPEAHVRAILKVLK